jgi:NAD-reducing hydrogenase small subunit
MKKKRIATTSLAGCFGCHMSLLDIDERLLDLLAYVEFDRSPLNDFKTFTQRCDIGLIEGGCCNEDNVQVLRAFRANCDVLVAVGQCAIMGGPPVMRNAIMHAEDPLRECLDEAYHSSPRVINPGNRIPADPALPLLLDKVYNCAEVVRIDYQIPGCPPSADALYAAILALVKGEEPNFNYGMIRYD